MIYMGSPEEFKEVVIDLKSMFGQKEDLDLLIIDKIEKDTGKKLESGVKAYIRYLLDQDEASRKAMTHKFKYEEGNKEDWR